MLMMSLVSSSSMYASFQVSMLGSLRMVTPERNVCAVAAAAVGAAESRKVDWSSRIAVRVDSIASMIAADVLPGSAVFSRSVLATVLAKLMIRFRSMFQHWQYSYGEMIRIRSISSESLKVTPKRRRNGLKLGCSRGGAEPLLWHTFVPTRVDGVSFFRMR
jgi:hypothetical protein